MHTWVGQGTTSHHHRQRAASPKGSRPTPRGSTEHRPEFPPACTLPRPQEQDKMMQRSATQQRSGASRALARGIAPRPAVRPARRVAAAASDAATTGRLPKWVPGRGGGLHGDGTGRPSPGRPDDRITAGGAARVTCHYTRGTSLCPALARQTHVPGRTPRRSGHPPPCRRGGGVHPAQHPDEQHQQRCQTPCASLARARATQQQGSRQPIGSDRALRAACCVSLLPCCQVGGDLRGPQVQRPAHRDAQPGRRAGGQRRVGAAGRAAAADCREGDAAGRAEGRHVSPRGVACAIGAGTGGGASC